MRQWADDGDHLAVVQRPDIVYIDSCEYSCEVRYLAGKRTLNEDVVPNVPVKWGYFIAMFVYLRVKGCSKPRFLRPNTPSYIGS